MKADAIRFAPDLASSSPLYVQLAQHLGQLVRDGRFKAHEALPSERNSSLRSKMHSNLSPRKKRYLLPRHRDAQRRTRMMYG